MLKEVEIPAIKKISVKTDYTPEGQITKRNLTVTVEVSETEALAIQELIKNPGSWTITIGIEAIQLPLEAEALASSTN